MRCVPLDRFRQAVAIRRCHRRRYHRPRFGLITMPADKPASKPSEHRRSNKPIMEKRRRARINNCLNELKNLLLEAMKKDPARHSKLEKADILEMTVKHLQNLQRQQMALAVAADPTVVTKYRAGFNECAEEVSRYVTRIDGIDPSIRQRLLNHLAACLTGLSTVTTTSSSASVTPLLAAGMPASAAAAAASSPVVSPLQLIPSRLSNGEIAFLLPGGQLPASHLIPIYHPQVTVATDNNPGRPTSLAPPSSLASSVNRERSIVTPPNSEAPTATAMPLTVNVACGSASAMASSPAESVISSRSSYSSMHSLSPTGSETGGCCSSRSPSPDIDVAGTAAAVASPSPVSVSKTSPPPRGEILVPVNLSKDADKMWRPW